MNASRLWFCAVILFIFQSCRKLNTYTCTCADTRGNVVEQFKVEAENPGEAGKPCMKQQEKWNDAGSMYQGTTCSITN